MLKLDTKKKVFKRLIDVETNLATITAPSSGKIYNNMNSINF